MRRILAATDFSERSDRALRRAGLLAQEINAQLILLHVVDNDRPERLVMPEATAAEDLLKATIGSLPNDVRCEVKVAFGDPFDGIANVAMDTAADFIVMGTHRKQILRDILVGTSIERVVRLRVAPVLMVNMEPEGAYKRSLVAVDMSEYSANALEVSRALGILPRSLGIALHVFDVPGKGKMSYAGVGPDKIAEHVSATAATERTKLAAFLDEFGGGSKGYMTRVEEGWPAKVIVDAAIEGNADLVVVGTNGRAGLPKLLLGSVTEEVMRRFDRDILVVPAKPRIV